MLHKRKILIAVTGGIAAYKTCELVRLLLKNRASVEVIMTKAATRFVAPLTFASLTGKPVSTDLFTSSGEGLSHLDIVRDLDLMAIVPATANCIGKLSHGIADDLISTVTLALNCPLLLCPAMNPKMYAHPAVQENVKILKKRGVLILDPEEGSMAHPEEESGIGRLPEPGLILNRICELLPPDGLLRGKTVIVTAGPTQESIDPVRIFSNRSSGKMGYALALEARRGGAEVHLISGQVSIPNPPGIKVTRVISTDDMLKTTAYLFEKCDALIMAAAPADFKPVKKVEQKIKKKSYGDGLTLKLQNTPDILIEIARKKKKQILVGFALETEDGLKNAHQKMREKQLDLVILNAPEEGNRVGIGKEAIKGTILSRDGGKKSYPVLSKTEFARIIIDRVQSLLSG